jgi:hypothetical protein
MAGLPVGRVLQPAYSPATYHLMDNRLWVPYTYGVPLGIPSPLPDLRLGRNFHITSESPVVIDGLTGTR